MYQMFNFKDALAFNIDLLSTFRTKGWKTYARQKLNSPFRSFTWVGLLEKQLHALLKSRVSSLPTVIFITSYRAFIFHSIRDKDSCTWHESSSPIRHQMKTLHGVFHWVSNSIHMAQTRIRFHQNFDRFLITKYRLVQFIHDVHAVVPGPAACIIYYLWKMLHQDHLAISFIKFDLQ